MSNNNNEMVKEQILADVVEMNTSCILKELDGGKMLPGMCESFDMRVATVDRDVIINRLVEMRFENMEVLHG
jgi:hypothetical protein|tara:strand:+ start:12662 stop:12877 length:216 start_codon:yes stop_codon:yes gene_type:complete